MANPRYACRTCGTWVCDRCGWKRPGASTSYLNHSCNRCPSRRGTMTATMHTERMWFSHNDEPQLPTPYAFGERPPSTAPRPARTGPDFYRGIRVPDTGPYDRLDVASWKRGVDDALSP